MKILLVIHRHWWERKCPPFWPDQVDALQAVPGVTVQVSGPKWPDWELDKSLRHNVEKIAPDTDVLYLWRPYGAAEFCGVLGAEEKLPWLKVSGYQDAPQKGAEEAKRVGLDLLFYHDHWDRQFFDGCRIRSVYLPLAVNLPLFAGWDRTQTERKTPVLLTGNQAPDTYPLRLKFNSIIRQRLVPGSIRKPSGYRMHSLRAIREEQQAYATQLVNSRISLVSTCPHIPLTLRKYFESMAAGCVLVGDMPHSPPAEIRDAINVVTNRMTPADIARRIRKLLNDEAECERQRIANRKIAESYGYDSFAARWVATVRESLESRET